MKPSQWWTLRQDNFIIVFGSPWGYGSMVPQWGHGKKKVYGKRYTLHTVPTHKHLLESRFWKTLVVWTNVQSVRATYTFTTILYRFMFRRSCCTLRLSGKEMLRNPLWSRLAGKEVLRNPLWLQLAGSEIARNPLRLSLAAKDCLQILIKNHKNFIFKKSEYWHSLMVVTANIQCSKHKKKHFL